MTFTTTTPQFEALNSAEAELDAAVQRRDQLLEALANPKPRQVTPSPGRLSSANEDIEVAAAKLEAAKAAAAKENDALPTEEEVRYLAADIGPQLDRSLDDIAEASDCVVAAVHKLRAAVERRNEAISLARTKLRRTGLPRTGSELDGEELGYIDNRVQFAGYDHTPISEDHLSCFMGVLGGVHGQIAQGRGEELRQRIVRTLPSYRGYLIRATAV